MKKIADIKEITHNDSDPSIVFKVSARKSKYKERILAYLKSGEITKKGNDNFIDVLSLREIEHTPLFYCDGEYEWSTEEIYYVEKYNLSLSEDFLFKIGAVRRKK